MHYCATENSKICINVIKKINHMQAPVKSNLYFEGTGNVGPENAKPILSRMKNQNCSTGKCRTGNFRTVWSRTFLFHMCRCSHKN